MKNLKISTVALVIGLAFSAGAIADTISKTQYKSLGNRIDAEYKIDKKGCNSFSGNAKDICVAQAKGKKSIAKAELEDKYKPTAKTRYEARIAKADAAYDTSIEQCDDKAGNDKDVCVKEAKAARTHEAADAKAQMKTSNADAVAVEKASDANVVAMDKATDAHKDAAADKRNADYAVEKEKCGMLAGSAKDQCIGDAKARFDKH